jgi:predicted transcriptional regulator
MISDAETDIEVEQILARIDAFIARLECLDATEIGFLRAGLENAQYEIKDGYRCMKSGTNLLRAVVEYEVEHGMSPIVGFV